MALWSTESRSVDFATFETLSFSVQRDLQRANIGCGDTVVFFARPTALMYAGVAAVIGLGGTALFIEPWMRQSTALIESLKPKAIIVDAKTKWYLRRFLPRKFPVTVVNLAQVHLQIGSPISVAVDELSAATITFTSGSCGEPKGVFRSHRVINNLVRVHSRGDNPETLIGPDLCIMNGLALLHLASGRGAVLVGHDWRSDCLRKIAVLCKELTPTTLSTGPHFLKQLIACGGIDSLKKIYIGGAPTDLSLMRDAFKSWPTTTFKHVYGSTEVEPISIIDARRAVEMSEAAGYFQMLHLGSPIAEVNTQWLGGELQVKSEEISAQTLSINDETGLYETLSSVGDWLKTGDHILNGSTGLIFQGRTNLSPGQFVEEQSLFQSLDSSRAFVHRNCIGRKLLVVDTAVSNVNLQRMEDSFGYNQVLKTNILTDRRHRSRLDRVSTLCGKGLAQRWTKYLFERSPPFVIALIAAGPAMAPEWRWRIDAAHLPLFCLSFSFIVLALIYARLADEIKDYPRDLNDHPGRPLPRGLLSLGQAESGAKFVWSLLAMVAGAAGLFCPASLLASMPTLFWLQLIRKNFFMSHFMSDHPVVSAFVHQLMVIPLYGMPLVIGEVLNIIPNPRRAVSYLAATLFGSLLFEFSRKMGPSLATTSTNYRRLLGPYGCAAIVTGFAVAFSYCLAGVGLEATALSIAIILSALIVRYVFAPKVSRLIEGVSALANLVALWAPSISRLLVAIARGI